MQQEQGSLNFSYAELVNFAQHRDTNNLFWAQFASEQQFYSVLKVVGCNTYKHLFKAVFFTENIDALSLDAQFAILCSIIDMGDKALYDDYFTAEYFLRLTKIQQDSIYRRVVKMFEDRELFESLEDMDARLGDRALELITPAHRNFSYLLSVIDRTELTRWLNKKLRLVLSTYKHAANYTPTARKYLSQGYGAWEVSEFPELTAFYERYKHYSHQVNCTSSVDWLVLSILIDEEVLFNESCKNKALINQLATNGMLPLVEACGRQHGRLYFDKLINLGVDIKVRDGNNHSALFAALARSNHDYSLLGQLIINGVNVNHRDFTHSTILYSLAPNLPKEVIQLMSESGALSCGPYEQIESVF